jgi:hypothetical protein
MGGLCTAKPSRRPDVEVPRVSCRTLSARSGRSRCSGIARPQMLPASNRPTAASHCVDQCERGRGIRAKLSRRSISVLRDRARLASRELHLVPGRSGRTLTRDSRAQIRATRRTSTDSGRRPEMARVEAPTLPPHVTSPHSNSPLAPRFSPLPTHPGHSPLVFATRPSTRPSTRRSAVQITSVSALPLPSPEIRISIPTAIQHASMNDPP